MKRLYYTALLYLLTGQYYCAQTSTDTIQKWVNGFYHVSLEHFSDNGEWSALRKGYDTNNDTLMVFNNKRPGTAVGYTTRNDYTEFLNNGYLLSSGDNQAELWNLKTQNKVYYHNVNRVQALGSQKQFVVLDRDQHLKWYNTDGLLMNKVGDVKDFITDKKNRFYFIRQHNGLSEVYSGYQAQFTKLYATRNDLSGLALSASERRLILLEKDSSAAVQRPVFITLKTDQVDLPAGFSVSASANFNIRELGNGDAYFFNTYETVGQDHPTVDIWYGNDQKLENKFMPHATDSYWMWNANSKELKKIPTDQFKTIIDVGSLRYFVGVNYDELIDYTSFFPDLNIWIYDADQDVWQFAGKVMAIKENPSFGRGAFGSSVPALAVSPNGESILYRKAVDQWELFHLISGKRTTITAKGNPVFSTDNRRILFEGIDLMNYDIRTGTLASLPISAEQQVEIVNTKKEIFRQGTFDFGRETVDTDQPMLLRIDDDFKNETAYQIYTKGKTSAILKTTHHHIRDFQYDKGLKKFAWLEEQYNMPTKLVYKNIEKNAESSVFHGNLKDQGALNLKQEIITYQNSAGHTLKGILYYPAHFNPAKKYPMVVKIYQIQRRTGNHYVIPEFYSKGDGFDIRTLLEKGYFVYLPDIVFGPSGTGLSAQDCVNSALDALNTHTNINREKIGLVGHSHGGYETNFIATHSDRFAAYISGAGNSDLVRSYFSFNYGFLSPFYFQFENGQYEMKKKFSDDKERYLQNSPIYHVEKVNAPVFLWAGKKDDNIAWDQVMEFYIGLKRNNKNVIAVFYPSRKHDLGRGNEEGKDLFIRMLEWWDYFLKDLKEVPWINKQMNKDKK